MKNNTLKKIPKVGLILYISIFILVGFYFMLMGILPVKIKIKTIDNVTIAQIHRKSMLPPFKDININMPNVKLAVVTSSRTSKGSTTYRVELEAYNGQRFPVTYYYSSGYLSKANLQDKINSAIQNKLDFDYIVRQPFMAFFGFIFMLISSIIMFSAIKKGSTTSTLKNSNSTSTTQTAPTNKIEPEEDKYKDINNSIIK